MARTKNGKFIGAAAAAQRRDTMNEIIEASMPPSLRAEKERLQFDAKFLRNSIRCLNGHETPEFRARLEMNLQCAEDRLSEIETAEILEWLAPSPADKRSNPVDYDTTDLPSPVIISGGEVLELSKTTNPDEEIPF